MDGPHRLDSRSWMETRGIGDAGPSLSLTRIMPDALLDGLLAAIAAILLLSWRVLSCVDQLKIQVVWNHAQPQKTLYT